MEVAEGIPNRNDIKPIIMCDYKILHHSADGYVVKCLECGCLKLAFGTTAMAMDEEQFYEFKKVVCEYHENYKHCVSQAQKRIHIPTALPSVSLLYSLDDLEQLSYLLDEAHLSLEIDKLLAE